MRKDFGIGAETELNQNEETGYRTTHGVVTENLFSMGAYFAEITTRKKKILTTHLTNLTTTINKDRITFQFSGAP